MRTKLSLLATALMAIAFLSTSTSAANYTCGLDVKDCTLVLNQGDYVQFWTGYQANPFNIEFSKLYLRFTDKYGNYAANLELKDGEQLSALGALTKARVNSINSFNGNRTANVTFVTMMPNLKTVVTFKPTEQWQTVTQGGAIYLHDYVTNVTVTNDGDTAVGGFTFSFILEQDGQIVGYPMDLNFTGPKVGQTIEIPSQDVVWSTGVLPKPLEQEPLFIRLVADRNGFIVESNKNDNELRITIPVVAKGAPNNQTTPTATTAPTTIPTALPTIEAATSTPVAAVEATVAPAPPTMGFNIELRVLIAVLVVLALAAIVLFATSKPRSQVAQQGGGTGQVPKGGTQTPQRKK